MTAENTKTKAPKKPTTLDAQYRAMVERMMKEGSATILDNYTFEHAVFLTSVMYNNARESALILTGEIAPGEQKELKDSFTKLVRTLPPAEGAAKKRVRVVTTKEAQQWVTDLAREYPDTLEVKSYPDLSGCRHFFAIDDKMVRSEYLHEPNTQDVKAKICFNSPSAAAHVRDMFDEIWEYKPKD